MKCFAFISCWKILMHCKRKFKGNMLMLVTIPSAQREYKREFLVQTGKVYTFVHQSKDAADRVLGYHTTQAAAACSDNSFCLENSAVAPNTDLEQA